MSPHFARAILLIQQGRYAQAEGELRQALAIDPEFAQAHAYLALSLNEQEKYEEAYREAKNAVTLQPNSGYNYFILAHVLKDTKRLKEATKTVTTAIQLDPDAANYYALLSNIQFMERDWVAALETAEKGLRLDPEHVTCQNLRAMALNKLGRPADSKATLDAALGHDPHNATTHANQGWLLLELGDTEKALYHFGEALRLEPNFEWARRGIITAMKSRNIIYRLFLGYFFWISKLQRKNQWLFVIGAYLLIRVLTRAAREVESIRVIAYPIIAIYVLFVFLTWTADSFFNLFLRLDRFGRLALTKDEIRASNWVGGSLLVALGCGIAWFITNSNPLLSVALFALFMVIPLSGTFRTEAESRGRKLLGWYTTALALVGGLGIMFHLLAFSFWPAFMVIYIFGILVFSFVANAVIMRQ